MCFGFGGGGQTSTTRIQQNPDAVKAGHMALTRVTGINNGKYRPYTGQRFEGFNNDQTGAMGMIRDFSRQPSVLSERLVDEGGKLGHISDYMDPYLANTLTPAIRDIQRAGTQQRVGIGNNATAAGAFGDARHGIAEGMQMRGEMSDVGDLSAQKYSDAYNTAMAERGADRTSMAGGEQDRMQRALALLGVGDRRQKQGQDKLDYRYQNFKEGQDYKFRQLDALLSFITGNKSAQGSTTTTSGSNNWLAQLLGGAAGSLL
jgi:nitrogen regulatory protein PII-like uncharacterized protein